MLTNVKATLYHLQCCVPHVVYVILRYAPSLCPPFRLFAFIIGRLLQTLLHANRSTHQFGTSFALPLLPLLPLPLPRAWRQLQLSTCATYGTSWQSASRLCSLCCLCDICCQFRVLHSATEVKKMCVNCINKFQTVSNFINYCLSK